MGNFANIRIENKGTAEKIVLNKPGTYQVQVESILTADSQGNKGKRKIQLFTVAGKNLATGNDFQLTNSDFGLYDEIVAYLQSNDTDKIELVAEKDTTNPRYLIWELAQ